MNSRPLRDRGQGKSKSARDRQQQYLKSHVDPCLKPLIRKCLRSPELPRDFQRWLYEMLRSGYRCQQENGETSHDEADFETTIHTLDKSVARMAEVFSVLNPAAYKLATESLSVLRSNAAELKLRYEKEHAEEARKKAEEEAREKAEEEARKKAEEEARKKAEEEARKKAEEEAKIREKKNKRIEAENKAKHKTSAPIGGNITLFLSYARGILTTPFARSVKNYLQDNGFSVWMDEESIAGGSDFMESIGRAIKSSAGIIAIIDAKFPTSTYCENELVMAQSNGLQLFPILFREMTFESMPDGIQYMLASTNCVNFPNEAEDAKCLTRFHASMCDVFKLEIPEQRNMRHNVSGTSKTATDGLARVPLAVPALPDQLCVREEILSTLRQHLLEITTGTKTSNKVVAHGQGGVGKTMVAAMIVNDPQIRNAFTKIGFISMGQTPNILELQKILFQQFTGTALPVTEDATAETQIQQMQKACAGKRYLLILDDLWLPEQEGLLNCVDETEGKCMATTRIRKLLPGCLEVPLNILTESESIELLLETGQVELSDAAVAAATKVARAVGHLPLYITICGGIINQYDGSDEWMTELLDELQHDRLSVISEGSGDSTVAAVCDASLRMVDEFTRAVFMSLGVCPEDVWIPFPVCHMICRSVGVGHGKITKIILRKAVKGLLDRNLLQGTTNHGVKQHDMVRELVRGRIGDNMREHQQQVVRSFADTNWIDDPVGLYAKEALKVHMIEGLGPDPLTDTAQDWLDAKEPHHFFPRLAAEVFGRATLLKMGESLEADGKNLHAARRFFAAASTDEPWASHSHDKGNTATSITRANVLRRAADMLEDVEETVENCSLGAIVLAELITMIPFSGEEFAVKRTRLKKILGKGVDVRSPIALLSISLAEGMVEVDTIGYTSRGAHNMQASASWESCLDALFSPRLLQALEMTPRNDPEYIGILWQVIDTVKHPMTRHHARARQLSEQFAPLKRWREYITEWDFDQHELIMARTFDGYWNCPCYYTLLVYGQLDLARVWLEKMVDVFETRDNMSDVTLLAQTRMCAFGSTNSVIKSALLGDLALRLLKALKCTFHEIEDTCEVIENKYNGGIGWETSKYCFAHPSLFISQMKRRHFLLAPQEIDPGAMKDWLSGVQAKWGSAGQGAKIDLSPGASWLVGGDCAEVYESLGRFDEAITAAETDLRNWRNHAVLVTQSHTVIGRCKAKLGQIDAATVAFEAAIDEAQSCELPFMEMLAIRDFIVHVLDTEGRRGCQMERLGRCVSAMALPPSSYNAVLGAGIDAEAAVAEYNRKTRKGFGLCERYE